jgi:uncharacterized protein YjbI with pentapeptide repeats
MFRSEHLADRVLGIVGVDAFAHEHPGYRQAAVDLLCGVLRSFDEEGAAADAFRREVQRALTTRLRYTGSDDVGDFWPDMAIDLSDAELVDGDFSSCRVRRASFESAVFRRSTTFTGMRVDGTANFAKARFTGAVDFKYATFADYAVFAGARFAAIAVFSSAEFLGRCNFGDFRGGGARFERWAMFRSVRFADHAGFAGVDFGEKGVFDDSRFEGVGAFNDAIFAGSAGFAAAVFRANASFKGVRFEGVAGFGRAVFEDSVTFDHSRFAGFAIFDRDRFAGEVTFRSARARLDQNAPHWPGGWQLLATDDDGWGELLSGREPTL